jgi:hypothetical protein
MELMVAGSGKVNKNKLPTAPFQVASGLTEPPLVLFGISTKKPKDPYLEESYSN